MTSKQILIGIIFLFFVILISGCIQQKEENERDVEKTALVSFSNFFCGWTEQSPQHAYFQFAYQDDGEIKYVTTKTSCDDIIGVYNASGTTLFGEQIKLHFKGENPVKIILKSGDVYEIKEWEKTEGTHIRNYFESNFDAIYYNIKYDILYHNRTSNYIYSNSDKVVVECLLVNDDNQHDSCLLYQAAFQQDVSICDKMILLSNQNLCKQWVQNIREGKININE